MAMHNQLFRVSASQINTFLNEPAVWVLNKFYKVYGNMGPAAWRGTAVEKATEAILLQGASHENALAWGYSCFDKDAAAYTGDDKAKERDLIEPMLEQAVDLFLQMDNPKNYQVKLEGEIEGVPILGFADFEYEQEFIDVKTTKRCPSCVENLSPEHLRQLGIYRLLTGKKQRIAYITDKKHALYEPHDWQYKQAEREVRSAIKAMKTAWGMDSKIVVTLYPPRSFKSFYWDESTISEAKQIWR